MNPTRYNMEKEKDVKKWFLEMEGYLKCGREIKKDFIHQGTDFEGRCYAMDGFRQLRILMYKQFEPSQLKQLDKEE